MKFITITLVAFSLSGCFYQTVNQYDLDDAVRICGGVEKIAEISSRFVGAEVVTCLGSGKDTWLHKNKD